MIKRGVDRRFYTTEYDFMLSPEKANSIRSEENKTDLIIQ